MGTNRQGQSQKIVVMYLESGDIQISPLLGMNLDNEKFYFKDKDGMEYMMEIWKGSYGFGMAYGAEIGIYYKNPDGKYVYTRFESGIPDWYASVEEPAHLKMKNTVWGC